jgi:hypothetical protein
LGRYVSDTRRSPGEAHARDVLGIIAPHAVGDGCIDQLIECIGQIDLAARDQRREPQRLGLEDTRAVAIHGSHNGALCGNQFGVGGQFLAGTRVSDLLEMRVSTGQSPGRSVSGLLKYPLDGYDRNAELSTYADRWDLAPCGCRIGRATR